MATIKRYQRQVYYGTAGTTAATQILCLVEVDLNIQADFDPTDVRGDGSTIPIMTEQKIKRKCDLKFKIRNETTGANATTVAALLAAAQHSSNPDIAIKVTTAPSGATQFDGDVQLEVADPDARELEFTCHMSRQSGRDPAF